jgi:hypothetical protein
MERAVNNRHVTYVETIRDLIRRGMDAYGLKTENSDDI